MQYWTEPESQSMALRANKIERMPGGYLLREEQVALLPPFQATQPQGCETICPA